jgi:hypothetical protein
MSPRRPAPFEARYGGPCAADCGERIHPGDPVRYVADELCHDECAGQVEDRPPARVELVRPCSACWTVHAGECL